MSLAVTAFACPSCGQLVTPAVAPLPENVAVCTKDGTALIPRGHFRVKQAEDDFYFGFNGQVMVNLDDLVETRAHPDRRRNNGCCAPDGADGVNRVCRAGHEVAIMKGDCWMPHAAISAVEMPARRFHPFAGLTE